MALGRLRLIRTAMGILLSPALIVLGWSLTIHGTLAPPVDWLMNAIIAYPSFFCLMWVSYWVLKVAGKDVIWAHALLVFILSFGLSLANNFHAYGIYGEFVIGEIQIVKDSQITFEGGVQLIEWSIRDGVLYALAFLIYRTICGTIMQTRNERKNI